MADQKYSLLTNQPPSDSISKITHSTIIVISVELWYHIYSIEASSTESIFISPLVYPPTTISWLLGRTAAIQSLRGVPMWLMTSQELVVGLYMWMAVVGFKSKSLPPIATCRPWMDTQAVFVTGGAPTFFHTLTPLFLKLARNNLQDRRRACKEHVYMLDPPRM